MWDKRPVKRVFGTMGYLSDVRADRHSAPMAISEEPLVVERSGVDCGWNLRWKRRKAVVVLWLCLLPISRSPNSEPIWSLCRAD
jgi:hypothetical protein